MPFFDRFWWLQTLAAILLLALGAFIVVGYILYFYPLEEELGEAHAPTIALALVIAVVFVVLALIAAERSFRAQERRRRRQRALAGDLAAMPPSRITVDAAKAPDVTHEPLTVMWRPRTSSIVSNRIVLACVILVILIFLGFAVFVLIHQPDPDPYVGGLGWLVPLFFTVEFGLIGVVTLQELPKALGTRTGVTATAAGVTWRTPWRRQRFVRWQDARLFEVIPTGKLDLARAYILYSESDNGTRRFVRWQDYGNDLEISLPGFPALGKQDYVPDGISPDEMAGRTRAILDLVAARTGPTPRTLHRGLQPADVARLLRPGAIASRAPFLVMGLFLLGLAVTSARFPPVALDGALDLVSALALALAGCSCLLFALLLAPLLARDLERERMPFAEGLAASAPPAPLPTPPTPPSQLSLRPGEAYVLPFGIPPFVRPSVALGGALLVVGGIPGYLWLVAWLPALFAPVVSGSGVGTTPLWDSANILGLVLTSFGLFGLLLLWTALFGRALREREIRADAAGLHLHLAGLHRDLSWEAVESLTLVTSKGRPQLYRIVGNSGKTDLGWPAQPNRWSRPPREHHPISPNALAALVAQQSGVPLTTADGHRVAPAE